MIGINKSLVDSTFKKEMKKYISTIRYVQENIQVTQSDTAKSLNLSIMTTNKVINSLLDAGIIVKSGKQSKKSGRRSELYKFNNNLYIAVGINFNEESIALSAVRSDSNVICKKQYEFPDGKSTLITSQRVMDCIVEYYHRFLDEFSIPHHKIAVIGISPEGIVDAERGRFVLGTHIGGIIDLNVRDKLQEIIDLPIFVDDPARSITYYEKKYGLGKGLKNFIYVYLSKGIGSGIVINDRIIRGSSGIAGEIGHIIVNPNGKRCRCGNYGCLETIASEESILRQIGDGIKSGVLTKIVDLYNNDINKLDLSVLRNAIEQDDKFSINILEHVGINLGKAVAILVNILNPEAVLIGGTVSFLGEHLRSIIERVMKNEALNVMGEKPKLLITDYTAFIGSISIAIEAFDALFYFITDKDKLFIENLIKKINK